MLASQKPIAIPSNYNPPTPPEYIEDTARMASNTNINSNGIVPASQPKHIWIITGPAGCGKTSVAEYLHEIFSIPYLEGDTVSSMTVSTRSQQ